MISAVATQQKAARYNCQDGLRASLCGHVVHVSQSKNMLMLLLQIALRCVCVCCLHPMCSGNRLQQTPATLLWYKVGKIMDVWAFLGCTEKHKRNS